MATYTKASIDGVELLIVSIDTAIGRDVAVQSPSTGGKHTSSDRGPSFGVSNVDILFCHQPGAAPYLDRYEAFRAMCAKAGSRVFAHPLHGSQRVKIEAANGEVDASTNGIRVRCTLLPDEEPTFVSPVAPSTAPTAGVEAVRALAEDATAELAAVGIDDQIPTIAIGTVTAWADAADLDAAQVFLEVGNRVAEIDVLRKSLEPDLDKWEAWRALTNLRATVVKAAQSFTADSEATFEVFVSTARPLLAICAEVYGAEEAPERAQQAAKNNRIRSPGRVPAGTTLVLAVPR